MSDLMFVIVTMAVLILIALFFLGCILHNIDGNLADLATIIEEWKKESNQNEK